MCRIKGLCPRTYPLRRTKQKRRAYSKKVLLYPWLMISGGLIQTRWVPQFWLRPCRIQSKIEPYIWALKARRPFSLTLQELILYHLDCNYFYVIILDFESHSRNYSNLINFGHLLQNWNDCWSKEGILTKSKWKLFFWWRLKHGINCACFPLIKQ